MSGLWVDIHGHFFPPMSEEEVQLRWKLSNENCFLLAEPYRWSLSSTLEYLDRAGISFQFLSNIPNTLVALKASNDYGASIVAQHPSRFGLLAAIPTDDASSALEEIGRSIRELGADGFAVTCCYNGVYLSDAKLDLVWEELNRLKATVFVHPNGYARPPLGQPVPLVEAAFETCRTIVSMLYSGHFSRFPDVRLVVAHCGGALPALASRLELLGGESWVPNPLGLTAKDIKEQLGRLFLDTAASCPSGLGPALEMTSPSNIVYGADCGVPCSTERTMDANRLAILNYKRLNEDEINAIGRNVMVLFPKTVARLG
ncbi:hypothetical protein BX600DRAFT_410809 [Xylariales sp. PMI_506]|nr:hypothetical protein BX600DRAFT_410809 [Xylariales sp. PMI_506]